MAQSVLTSNKQNARITSLNKIKNITFQIYSHSTTKSDNMNELFESIQNRFLSMDLYGGVGNILEYGEEITLTKGMSFTPAYKCIYIPLEGYLSMYWYKQNHFIGITPEKMPLGLIESFVPSSRFKYTCETAVRLVKVNKSTFLKMFKINNEDAIKIISTLAHACCFLIYTKKDNVSEKGYSAIVAMLYRYQYRKQQIPDFSESIAAFIIKRTMLSRSYVFKVLSELKQEEYITTHKGKLVSINRKIPVRF